MTRILLTGAGGFIGHHTLDHLLKNTSWEIVCIESFRHKGMTSRIREVLEENPTEGHRVSIISQDLTAPIDKVTEKKIGHIDVIINMASESHVDRSIEEPRHFIENNIMLVTTMLDYARTLPDLKLFIQVSTDEVYGPIPEGKPHPEYDTMLPSNPYSASKAAQEAIAIAYWRTYDVPVVITNTMNNIGERQDPEKFVPKIIKNFLENKKIQVHARKVDDTWVAGGRVYLHAINHADALLFIINNIDKHLYKRSQESDRPRRFHITGEHEITNDQMAKMVASALGTSEDLIEYQDVEGKRPGHDLHYGLELGTLHEWGWAPPISFDEALDRTIKWTLDNRHWL